MRVNSLTEVKVTEYGKSISSFKEITEKYENIRLSNDKIDKASGFLTVLGFPSSDKIIGLVKVEERLFALGYAGKVYEIVGGEYKLLFVSETTLVSGVPIIVDGESAVMLLFEGREYYIVKTSGEISAGTFPFFTKANCLVGDSIYFGYENKLVFDKNYDFENIVLGKGNFINLPNGFGKIIALVSREKKVLIFTEGALYELSAFGELVDYQLKRILTFSEPIKEATVKRVGDYIYFFSGNYFYKLSGESARVIDTTINLKEFTVNGSAARMGEKYILPLIDKDGSNGAFIYNALEKEEENIKGDIFCVTDEGYFISDLSVSRICEDGSPFGESVWESKSLDFGTLKKKVLTGVTVVSDIDCNLSVRGERSTQNFLLKNVISEKKMRIDSRVFSLKISSETGVRVSNVQLKYRIKGE